MFDRYTKLFCIGYVVFTAMLYLTAYILNFLEFDQMIPIASFVVMFLGPSLAGIKYAQEVGIAPNRSISWKYAFKWAFISIAVYLVLIVVLALIHPMDFTEILKQPILIIFMVVFMFLLYLLIYRFSFSFFVKSQLKAIEKKNARK